MNPITVFLTVACLAAGAGLGTTGHLYAGVAIVIVAIIIASALKMANTWQKFVILRAGKLRGVKGPGLFLIIPVIDHIVAIIDERIQTTAFYGLRFKIRKMARSVPSTNVRAAEAPIAASTPALQEQGGTERTCAIWIKLIGTRPVRIQSRARVNTVNLRQLTSTYEAQFGDQRRLLQ